MCALILTVFTCSHLTSLGYLLSLFLVLIHHPEVQRRIQREVDEVVGRGRRPRVDDRPSMPYTEATVLEIFRYASNLPLTAGRKATKEMELTDFGLTIPKDTSIIINAWYIHHDERIFTDPWAFNPERFLDSHGRLLPPTDPKRIAVNNFGLGERMCPASDFAESRFFLYVTTLLQKFDLDPPTKREQLPSCDPRTYCPGTILQPRVFSTKITKRVN
ncbi:cytochrome P450 1A5 [Aplysia californica]|uniref:unspecific monooxygenase n=1 Tax=Aplysia californica TaxID=6500 RepID=A0ABM1A1C2_APLCA|nr:cytochrome P450 1A5 [Aplysia californica]